MTSPDPRDPFGDRISVVQDDPGPHDPDHPGHIDGKRPMTSPDPREREDGTLDEAMTSGLIEDAEQDRALVTEWDETLPALPVEPVPLDPQRLWRALVNVWPRTFGNRTSWTQPEFDMAVAAAREYDRLARRAASVTSPDPREREEPRDMRDISHCWQFNGWHAFMAGPCFDTYERAVEYRDALDARGLSWWPQDKALPPIREAVR